MSLTRRSIVHRVRTTEADRSAELADLRARLLEAETMLAALPDLHEALGETTVRRDALALAVAELEALCQARADRIAALEAELAHNDATFAAMRRSASWRLTAPLRALKRLRQ